MTLFETIRNEVLWWMCRHNICVTKEIRTAYGFKEFRVEAFGRIYWLDTRYHTVTKSNY